MVALLSARLSDRDERRGPPGIGDDPRAATAGWRGVVCRSIGIYVMRRFFGRPRAAAGDEPPVAPPTVIDDEVDRSDLQPPWMPGRASISTYGAFDEPDPVAPAVASAPVVPRSSEPARSDRSSRRRAVAMLAGVVVLAGVAFVVGPSLLDQGSGPLHVTRANQPPGPGPTGEVAGETSTPAA